MIFTQFRFFWDTLYIIDTMIILGSNQYYLACWSTLKLFVSLKHINIWYFIFHVSVFVIIVVYLVQLGAYRHEFVLVRLMITTELQLFISRYFLYTKIHFEPKHFLYQNFLNPNFFHSQHFLWPVIFYLDFSNLIFWPSFFILIFWGPKICGLNFWLPTDIQGLDI